MNFLRRWLNAEKYDPEHAGNCVHENGWRNVCDDGRHDALIRTCVDCGARTTISRANPR